MLGTCLFIRREKLVPKVGAVIYFSSKAYNHESFC